MTSKAFSYLQRVWMSLAWKPYRLDLQESLGHGGFKGTRNAIKLSG